MPDQQPFPRPPDLRPIPPKCCLRYVWRGCLGCVPGHVLVRERGLLNAANANHLLAKPALAGAGARRRPRLLCATSAPIPSRHFAHLTAHSIPRVFFVFSRTLMRDPTVSARSWHVMSRIRSSRQELGGAVATVGTCAALCRHRSQQRTPAIKLALHPRCPQPHALHMTAATQGLVSALHSPVLDKGIINGHSGCSGSDARMQHQAGDGRRRWRLAAPTPARVDLPRSEAGQLSQVQDAAGQRRQVAQQRQPVAAHRLRGGGRDRGSRVRLAEHARRGRCPGPGACCPPAAALPAAAAAAALSVLLLSLLLCPLTSSSHITSTLSK